MPSFSTFEFEAPQFIESWENATNIDDGADNFFDALETLEPFELQRNRRSSFMKGGVVFQNNDFNYDIIKASSGIIKVQNISEDIENAHALACNNDNKERRLSMKRKASPLKDRNICVPSSTERQRLRKLAIKPAIRFLPTIPQSPVLLTKNRVRPMSAKKSPENRLILKPVRKRNLGVCVKPLPKPPTIPEPFNLTEAGKHVHQCYEDPKKDISHTSITPGRKRMKTTRHRDVHEFEDNLFGFKTHTGPKANSSFISTASTSGRNIFNVSMASSIGTCGSDKSMAFSFYERDKELLKRKQERMNQVEVTKYEFKAREPTVLTKEPFWPEIESRTISTTTNEGLKKFELRKKKAAARRKALEEELSKGEVTLHEFKAREPTVLTKEPFYPEIESRTISGGITPDLATVKRAEERKKFEKKVADKLKALEEELKKAEEEEIRKLRKTLEFKARAILRK